MSNSKHTRVQKICTLWTHDENFSKDDIVFNSDKFPELPTTPGSLLQIVAINSGTAIRDFSTANKPASNETAQGRSEPVSKDHNDPQPWKSRRGSLTKTIDENGSVIAGSRDFDAEKTYIFAPKPLPQDLRAKHSNLQISIAEKIAKVFGFRNRTQVVITEVGCFSF